MNTSGTPIERALQIALWAHRGQVDKAGQAYILHPLRIMLRLGGESEKVTALLHDVVEDSDITMEHLRGLGFADEVLTALDCLTKRDRELYDDFIGRVLGNALAVKVKIEDIKDNMDLTRLSEVTEKDLARLAKYHRALKRLQLR